MSSSISKKRKYRNDNVDNADTNNNIEPDYENKQIVNMNDILEVEWPFNDDIFHNITVKVIKIKKSKKLKHKSYYKYTLKVLNNDEFDIKEEYLKTRLLHLNWRLKSNNKTDLPFKSNINDYKKTNLPSHKFILAPMVGGSELAFRLLCRKYGVQLAYTPMINSERFSKEESYRLKEFQTTSEDRPLVAHFSGNDPDTMLLAAKFVEDKCDAIDLNLGCPQRIAHAGHFGSYLLGPEDRDLIINIVKKLSDNMKIPIFVKIRLLDTVPDTIELCKQLITAGASLIAIHARYRVNLVGRTGPGARDGAAHLDQVLLIKKVIDDWNIKNNHKYIPIIANGNVRCYKDVIDNLEFTKADGIMSAEGILDDPAIFSRYEDNIKQPDKISLAIEYLDLVIKYPVMMKSIIFHIRRILKEELTNYQLMEDLISCQSLDTVRKVVLEAKSFKEKGNYIFDPEKEKKAKQALERRKQNEGKRKAYEERMMRKAKREGKDLSYYLQQGIENPTIEDLQDMKKMSKEDAFKKWKEKHHQHCFEFHFNPLGCHRERTCSFLHADAIYGDTLVCG